MEDLEEEMPSEDLKKFSENFYFTFLCISKIWSGVFVRSDMNIQKDLMRAMETTVGGRQISLGQWVRAVPYTHV